MAMGMKLEGSRITKAGELYEYMSQGSRSSSTWRNLLVVRIGTWDVWWIPVFADKGSKQDMPEA